MESLEKIKTEKLRETVIQGIERYTEIVIVQYKESYKGVSTYIVTSDLVRDGTYCDVLKHYATSNREKSDRYFSMLESGYSKERIISKIF